MRDNGWIIIIDQNHCHIHLPVQQIGTGCMHNNNEIKTRLMKFGVLAHPNLQYWMKKRINKYCLVPIIQFSWLHVFHSSVKMPLQKSQGEWMIWWNASYDFNGTRTRIHALHCMNFTIKCQWVTGNQSDCSCFICVLDPLYPCKTPGMLGHPRGIRIYSEYVLHCLRPINLLQQLLKCIASVPCSNNAENTVSRNSICMLM